ncbi:MAG TPA: hypothetical protein VGF97_03255 [Rhizomicrobium sp.]|jgi:hypothetical protein
MRAFQPVSGWRFAFAALLALIFAFQTYVIQTHIHVPAGLRSSVGVPVAGTPATRQDRQDKYPANDDPANCPICQEMLHSGQFITPAAILALPPALAVSTIVTVEQALPFVFTLSHSWRGRAPPHS